MNAFHASEIKRRLTQAVDMLKPVYSMHVADDLPTW